MKYLCLILSLLPLMIKADEDTVEVDFSKAYVVKGSDSTLRIGGVETHTIDETFVHALLLGFNPKRANFQILEAESQTTSAQLLEQQLRDTTWTGSYKTSKNYYQTKLYFESVQYSYIGGEIYHTTTDPENPVFLRAKVAGNLVTQYLIELKDDVPQWIDADQIDYEALPPTLILPPAELSHIRQIIRFKRLQALAFKHNEGGWGTYNEYRLALVGEELTGVVGTPTDRFGSDDAMTGVGEITLIRKAPIEADNLPE